MNKEEIRALMEEALDSLKGEKPPLPIHKVGELALVGRFAFHLSNCLNASNLMVDVEYSIDPDGDLKRLGNNSDLIDAAKNARRKVYENGMVVVRPDIIIHERGNNKHNIAVIEVKFLGAKQIDTDYAEKKLKAFQRSPFNYRFGILIKFPRDWGAFLKKEMIKFIYPD